MYVLVKDVAENFEDSVKTSFLNIVRKTKRPITFAGCFSDNFSKFTDDFVEEFIQSLSLKTFSPQKIDKALINHLFIRKQKRTGSYKTGKEMVENFLKTSALNPNRRGLLPSFDNLLSHDYVSHYFDIEALDSDNLNDIEIPFGKIENGKLVTQNLRGVEFYNSGKDNLKTYYHIFLHD